MPLEVAVDMTAATAPVATVRAAKVIATHLRVTHLCGASNRSGPSVAVTGNGIKPVQAVASGRICRAAPKKEAPPPCGGGACNQMAMEVRAVDLHHQLPVKHWVCQSQKNFRATTRTEFSVFFEAVIHPTFVDPVIPNCSILIHPVAGCVNQNFTG